MFQLKLSFSNPASAKRSKQFIVALAISALTPLAGIAQKIEDNKIWSTFKKSPVVLLTPEFATYSIEHDFGNMVVPAKETPEIQNLKFQKTDGDLTLKITANKLFIIDKTQKVQTSKDGNRYYYVVNYNANYGYDLVNKKSETTLYAYKRKNGFYTTPAFNSISDLETYVKNAFMADLIEYLQTKINKRIQYDLMEHNFDVRVAANSIKGTTPAFTEINKASADFAAHIAEKTPQKEAILPQIAVWEKHLANADWKGKGEINKKVANALIENLCAAYMLTGDFGKLRERADLFEKNNSGVLANLSPLMFEIDQTYSGPSFSYHTIRRKDKFQNYLTPKYYEFSYDLVGVLN